MTDVMDRLSDGHELALDWGCFIHGRSRLSVFHVLCNDLPLGLCLL